MELSHKYSTNNIIIPIQNPAVSVIIPVYNQAHYVGWAIKSVLDQTLSNWEIIIIDDGSTDNTKAIIAQFPDPRIRYIFQKNQGLSAARNTGIWAATGTYLAFLDADDEWEPEFLKCCVDELKADDTLAGVYTLIFFITPQGVLLPRIGGQAVSRPSFRRRLLQGGFFPPCAVLVKASVVRQVSLFDTRFTSLEDWDLWLLISRCYEMQSIAKPLARYRIYPGSMSTNAMRMHTNRIAVLTKHFGPPEGDPMSWSKEKRFIYGFGYRESAFGFIEQDQFDEGWHLLRQAALIWPALLEYLDTFYEVVCGNQTRGYRGQADLLDIEGNGAKILGKLDILFAETFPLLNAKRRCAYGNTYLTLAILSDRANRWSVARSYLFRAIWINPRLLTSYSVMRRLLKLCAGKRLVNLVSKILDTRQGNIHKPLAEKA